MNILIHSNNIYFNIGLAQCFRDIQETLPGLNIIHSLPLSHLPDPAGLDVIILALENYHDYQAAAELAQRYPGLGGRIYLRQQRQTRTRLYADTLLWVSQRESVQEIRRLLLRLADRSRPFAPRHQRQSRSSRLRAPLNDLEMQMIRGVVGGQSTNQMADTLGVNRKRVYNGLERIKSNFRLASHTHFHHFITAEATFSRLCADLSCYRPGTASPATTCCIATGRKSFILFE